MAALHDLRDTPAHADAAKAWLTAAEAMLRLGVRAQTLYAYVSRGWIRSIAQPGRKQRLYRLDDVQRVESRSAARAGHAAVAAAAMNWGEPIIATAITEITPQGPRYRGQLAADLVREGCRFEAVAELLWTGRLPTTDAWPASRPSADLLRVGRRLAHGPVAGNLLESFALVLLQQGTERGSVAERIRRGQTLAAARQMLQTAVACCGFAALQPHFRPLGRGESVVEGLAHALGIAASAENRAALEAMLILMADHELSPGTLTARVVASGGGTLHSSVAAALCATSGVEVGRLYARVDELLGQARSHGVLLRRAERLLAQGQAVPGFHHPLYPEGDPRALQLLALARQRSAQDTGARAVFRFIDALGESAGLRPRQELALVLLTRMMGLGAAASTAIFALGRMAGWTAHVLEQRERGTLLRPRARFEPDIGPAQAAA